MEVCIGILIPLIGTTLGAACVFLLRGELNHTLQKGLLGFASGVMVAASVWSLLIPAIEMSGHLGKLAFFPAAVGLLLGMGFLMLMDRLVPHLYPGQETQEGFRCDVKKNGHACPCNHPA